MRYAQQLEDTLRLQHEAHRQLIELQKSRGLVGDHPDLMLHIEQILEASINLFNLEDHLDKEAIRTELKGDYKGWTLDL